MDSLSFVFYDRLASLLEKEDLRKISSELGGRTLKKACEVHSEHRKKELLHQPQFKYLALSMCDVGAQIVSTLFQKWKFEDFNFAIHGRSLPDLDVTAWSSESDEGTYEWTKACGTRCKSLEWEFEGNAEENKRKSCELFLASGLSRVPFTDVDIPYVDHRSEEFLRRQVSFGCLEGLYLTHRWPPSMWGTIQELLHQPQFKWFGGFYKFDVGSQIFSTLFQKWKFEDFNFDLKGRRLPDFDVADWSSEPNKGMCEWTEACGTRCKSLEVIHPRNDSMLVRFTQRGEEVYIFG
uniref:TIR domain-containing protein n=1 Tax=Steinernema glaseri TaxID=37863 RepID=A0A1I7YY38_9BILA